MIFVAADARQRKKLSCNYPTLKIQNILFHRYDKQLRRRLVLFSTLRKVNLYNLKHRIGGGGERYLEEYLRISQHVDDM